MEDKKFFVDEITVPSEGFNNKVFDDLFHVNVKDYTEKKDGLTYLSWTYAWSEVKKRYPSATYQVMKFNGLPYVCDHNTGYMVYTTVTIEGQTHEMWLPVMDGKNKAMKPEPYTYTTKYGEKSVEAATMFDINKTIMRCLVKNLAMFGLGLYIFSGEDLPEADPNEVERLISETRTMLKSMEQDEKRLFNGKMLEDMSQEELVKNNRIVKREYDKRNGISGTPN